MNFFWTSYLTKFFLVIQCSNTQALKGNHESCPISGGDCSSEVQECPSAVPGTPLEIRTKRNGVFVITGNAGPDAKWRNILREEVTACLKEITPGGKESGNIPQYLCRTIFNSQWMTGKLAFHENNCDFTCDVYVGFTELKIPITNDKPNQILSYREPTLSWVKYPTDDGGLPDTIANAGQRGEVLPICRHTDEDGSIFLGIFLRDTKQCAFVKGGKGSTANTNIEILAPPSAPKSYADKSVGWRTVTGKDVKNCLKIVEPNGMENNHPVYRCRTLYSLQWVPGKLMYDETLCKYTCNVFVDGDTSRYPIDDEITQIIIDTNSITKWVEYNANDGLPADAINGGGQTQNAVFILCRYKDGSGNTFLGTLFLDFKYCWYINDDVAYPASEDVEILVSAGVDLDKSCPDQPKCDSVSERACLVLYNNITNITTVEESGYSYWQPLGEGETLECLKRTYPLGVEPGPRNQYLCRVFYEGKHVPGKLAVKNSVCNAECEMIIGNAIKKVQVHHEDLTVEILTYELRDIKWLKVSELEPSQRHVVLSGKNNSEHLTAICRFNDKDGNKYIGHFNPGLNYDTCWYQEGEKVSFGRGEKVEILVQQGNSYVARSERQRPCTDLSTVCHNGKVTHVPIGVLNKNAVTKTGYARDDIIWKHVAKADVVACLTETTRGGVDKNMVPQYICQTLHKGLWIPGKIILDEDSCEFTCDIGDDSKTVKRLIDDDEKTQILMFRETAVSWVKLSCLSDTVNNTIIGGENVNGDFASICRVVNDEGEQLTGRFFPACMTCLYTIGDKEISESNPFNIEILLQTVVKHCPKQKATCASSAGDTVETGVYQHGAKKVETAEKLKWTAVKEDEITARLKAIKPIPQYICRVFYEFHWTPGILESYDDPCSATCDIIVDFKVIKVPFGERNKIHVLNTGSGSTTWESFKANSTSIDNFIVGGKNSKEDVIPLCVYKDDNGNKYIGHFALGHKACWYFSGDKVSISCNAKRIEVLVSGTRQPSCPPDLASGVKTGVIRDKKFQAKGNADTRKIHWKTVTKNNVEALLHKTTIAATLKSSKTQYFCRSYQNCTWQPGTLIYDKSLSDLTCDLTSSFEHKHTLRVSIGVEENVQLLTFAPADYWWDSIKSNSIVAGGVNGNGGSAPFCRYWDVSSDSVSVAGIYWPETGHCTFRTDEKDWDKASHKLEFLAQNNGNCHTQVSECVHEKWDDVKVGTVEKMHFKMKTKAGSEMQWSHVGENNVRACLSQVWPNGMEANNITQYICRSRYNTIKIPGIVRYIEHNCKFSCDIIIIYGEKRVKKIPITDMKAVEIFMYSNESVCWSNLALYTNLPNVMINGGQDFDYTVTPICRYRMEDGTVHIGKFSPIDRSCSIIKGDTEVAKTKASNIEILLSTATNKCQKPICELGETEYVRTGGVYNGIFQFTGYAVSQVKWRFVKQDNVLAWLQQTTHAGMGPNNTPVYICRTFHKETNFWMMGTIHYDENACELTCDVGTGYKATKYPIKSDGHTQILMAEKGYTSWIRKSIYPTLPDKLISGGKNIGGEFNPICRVASGNGDEVYLGQYYPYFGTCWYTNAESEIPDGSLTMEILVEENPNQCQLTFCGHGERESVRTGGVYNGIFQFKGYAANNVQWRFVQQNDVRACLLQTIPAGVGPNNIPIYICRTFRRETKFWMMGTIHFNENTCEFTCDVGTDYKSTKFPIKSDGHTQILMAEKGSTSWIRKSSYPTLPDKLISGGKNIGGEFNPICRVASGNEDEVYLGQYYPFHGNCWYTTSDKEVPYGNATMEILVEENPKQCQLTFCEYGTRESVEVGGVIDGQFKRKGYAGSHVLWRYIQHNDVRACLRQTSHAGMEPNNIPTYICRTFIEGSQFWMAGKIYYDEHNCEFTCNVGFGGRVNRYPIKSYPYTQLLMFQNGGPNWIKKSNTSLADKVLVAGESIARELSPICRIPSDNANYYLGIYQNPAGLCWYTTYDKETADGSSNLEILMEG